jgi:hypothetical protein
MADVSTAFAEPSLTVAQTVWWILTRDGADIGRLEHVVLEDVRKQYLRHEFEAARSGRSCHPSVTEIADLLRDEPIHRAEVEALNRELQANATKYIPPQSRKEIDRRFDEFRAFFPKTDPSILRMGLSKRSAEFHLTTEFHQALEELLRRLARGSVFATGRRNRIHDRTKIDAAIWPDYLFDFVDVLRLDMVVALPQDPKQFALALVCTQDPTFRPHGREASIWADVRLSARDVQRVWPIRQTLPTPVTDTTKRRRTSPNLDDKHRDVHARLASAVRRIWPQLSNAPSLNRMAEELVDDPVIKATGYKTETVRKMLNGTYPAFRQLGLPTLIVGTNTNLKHRRTRQQRIPTSKQ